MNKKELINVPRILFPVGTEVLIKGKIVGLRVLDNMYIENVVKLACGEQIIVPNNAIYVKGEPEAGHADEAPRYVKNILARLRELPLHDREVWLKAIMGEFEKDFSHAKWREGHEVEKEKKYKVVLLNYNDGHLNLVNVRTLGENIIFFTKKTQFDPRSLKLTKAEIISSGFGWVFDCPGIKIEEVKDE